MTQLQMLRKKPTIINTEVVEAIASELLEEETDRLIKIANAWGVPLEAVRLVYHGEHGQLTDNTKHKLCECRAKERIVENAQNILKLSERLVERLPAASEKNVVELIECVKELKQENMFMNETVHKKVVELSKLIMTMSDVLNNLSSQKRTGFPDEENGKIAKGNNEYKNADRSNRVKDRLFEWAVGEADRHSQAGYLQWKAEDFIREIKKIDPEYAKMSPGTIKKNTYNQLVVEGKFEKTGRFNLTRYSLNSTFSRRGKTSNAVPKLQLEKRILTPDTHKVNVAVSVCTAYVKSNKSFGVTQLRAFDRTMKSLMAEIPELAGSLNDPKFLKAVRDRLLGDGIIEGEIKDRRNWIFVAC